ncbi:hypothetical protein H4Q26_015083 [Puccinia striiformis f. sp. tritici PST-130]|nr:hypothetical protein H4Q26_015083 [Puccinia striiformis f. sp. tritici PST-130]
MRQLKHHEKKLLKKVDFLQWKNDSTLREAKVMRRYHVQRRLSLLAPQDPFRGQMESALLDKLYDIGIWMDQEGQKNHKAVQYIEQGHIRVGPDLITDPAFLVTRNMEDFITWVDTSKLKRHIQNYAGQVDDFDLL